MDTILKLLWIAQEFADNDMKLLAFVATLSLVTSHMNCHFCAWILLVL